MPGVETLILRTPVAAGIFGIFRFNWQLDKSASQALHLFLGRRSKIIGRCYRSQPTGRSDRLQSSNTCSNHKNPRRRDGSSGSGEHREDSGKGIGGDQDGLIPADGSHGRERIHALRACGTRHKLNGKRSHTGIGNLLYHLH